MKTCGSSKKTGTRNLCYYLMSWVVELATVVENDLKAPFSIASTPRCRGGRYFIPWNAPLYPWYCYILTFDPAQKCYSKVIVIEMASNRKRSRGRIKAYDMGQGEGPIVPLTDMHRKRVTSELHDSYFRLMTIKTSDSKIQ